MRKWIAVALALSFMVPVAAWAGPTKAAPNLATCFTKPNPFACVVYVMEATFKRGRKKF